MKSIIISGLIITLFLFPLSILLFVRANHELPTTRKILVQESTGKELAERYCQMCHMFPEPELLDKTTWANKVLPNMGMRLGIRSEGENPFTGMDATTVNVAKYLNIYPDSALVSKQDWQKIVEYYERVAPRNLPKQDRTFQNNKGIFPFEGKCITIDDNPLPQITLLKYDLKSSALYVGDYLNLYVLDGAGNVNKKWKLNSPASFVEIDGNKAPLILTLGKLGPTDQRSGTLSKLIEGESSTNTEVAFPNLGRPVNFATADLNMDNKKDIVICNFGNYGGKLSWFADMDQSKEHVLKNMPGATRVEIRDLNGDNKPDLIVLMAQAFEQIIIFYNKGNGEFEEKPVLQFNPAHGTSYFELADFNQDGFEDLLVTNGDNRDISAIDKPYHGIRVYLNDGHDNFMESFFYPMYECSKAMARDFDNDGDLDIVAISFTNGYSSLKNPKESFVYLSNNGELNFSSSFSPDENHGKWLTMEVADFNKDGLLDVVLGAYIFSFSELGNVMAATNVYSFPQLKFYYSKP
jgi:hypothetical protein